MLVKELILELAKLDPDLPVLVTGADCGGYDVKLNCDVKISQRKVGYGKKFQYSEEELIPIVEISSDDCPHSH